MIKKKKGEYKLNIINEMKVKKKEQKIFWKLLEKLKTSKTDLFKNTISGNRWNDHFKEILRDETREIIYPVNILEQGPLDNKITTVELCKAS